MNKTDGYNQMILNKVDPLRAAFGVKEQIPEAQSPPASGRSPTKIITSQIDLTPIRGKNHSKSPGGGHTE